VLWGSGLVAEGQLRTIGVQTLGQLAALSEPDAVATLGGVVGRELRRLAGGADDRPVADRGETKQVSAETTFDIDIIDLPRLRAEVRRITTGAHARLLKAGRVARTVVIKLRHTDMHTVTRSETISAPTHATTPVSARTRARSEAQNAVTSSKEAPASAGGSAKASSREIFSSSGATDVTTAKTSWLSRS